MGCGVEGLGTRLVLPKCPFYICCAKTWMQKIMNKLRKLANNKYIKHWCILIWKSKHIRCQFIDKYPLWVQFSSNPRKVPSLRVYLPHSLWGEIEVLPPVESRLEPLNGSEELIKVVLFCCWRRIVYHEGDVAGVSAIVRAELDVISECSRRTRQCTTQLLSIL